MFKRKLFKRALPVILSVAMIFQSTPATALAAENAETEAIVETAEGAEPSDDSSDAGSADSSEPSEVSPASEDAPTADGNSEEQAKEETEGQSTETAKVEESKNDESKAETAQTEESKEESKEEGTSTEASKTEEAPSETVAENQGTETTTTAAEESTEAVVEATSEVEADGEAADVNAEQAALDTVIVVKDELKGAFKANGAKEDTDAEVLTFKSAYSVTENPYSNILSTVEDALSHYLGVEIDGSENKNLPSALKVKWQKKAADKDEWADIATYPTEVGTYRLLISLDEVADLCKNAEASVNVIIEQAQLTVDVSEIVATPGTTVEAFKAQVAEEYILRNASASVNNGEEYPEVAKETLVKSITVTVLNAYDKSEVKNANDDGTVNVLATNGDYVMTIAVELLDNVKANYTVESGKVYDFTVAEDLVETKVIATKIDPGKEITMVYNGQAPDEENLIKKAVNPVKVVIAGDEEKAVSFKEDQITLGWYTKKIDIEDENGSEVLYEKLAEAPKDAGEYYVKYLYSGEPNVYKESESDAIKVTIEQIPLVLRPEKKDPELKAGMTLDEVRKQLAELKCELFEIKVDEAGKETESPYEAEKGFWGVSYKDKDTTEYYTPVLRLECREAEKDEEGNLVKEDNKIKYGEWKSCEEALSELGELKETSDEIQYRLIFSGKKAVFNADGTTDGKEVDITDTTTMGAEKNYLVRADKKTLEDTAVDVTVGTAIATEIDVTEIIKAFNGKTDFAEKDKAPGTEENPLWKIYDTKPLFTSRDAYKKAVVKTKKAEDADPGDTAEQLTYEWFVQGDDGEWYSLFDMVVTGADYSVFANQITNVNTYKLQVRYEDPKHKYLSATKDIVFEIRKQEIIVVPESLTARAGKEQDDVTGKIRIYAIPENNEETFWKLTDEQKLEWVILEQELFAELGNYDSYDIQDKYLKSTVERREMNPDGTPKDTYVPMGNNEKFIDGYQYRAYLYYNLEAAGIRNFTNRNKTAMNIAASEAEEETWIAPIYHYNWADVAVKTIGSEELELMVDETKLPKSHVYGESVAYANVQEAFESGLIQFVLKNDHAQVVKPEELFGVDKEGKPDYASGKLIYNFDYKPLDKRLESGYTKTAVNAGTYSLHIYFEGNETYTDVDDTYEYSFEITQRPLTIKPTLAVTAEDVIPAGEVVDTIYDTETTPFSVDGVAVLTDADGNTLLDDTQGFEYGTYTSKANGDRIIGYPALYTHENNGQTVYNCIFGTNYWVGDDTVSGDDYLRYGKTYQVKFDQPLGAVYENNYDVAFLPSASYEVKARANALVEGLRYGYDNIIEGTRLDASITEAGKSQTITPAEGIPFVYKVSGLEGEEKPVNGNFFAFAITAPKEFATKFPANGKLIYENSIKAAGGYVLGTDTVSDNDYERFRIYVAFNATGLAEDDKTKEFSIRWEDDYVETFTVDFSKAELEADLELAVAPKSLAFNGINSKMVVGEEQALDVKVTKMQLGDIISIGYRTEDSDVISIDPKSGVVTALKVSSKPVEIQAYAYKLVDGKEEEFPKPVAKAKISVTDVTAPVIKKIDQIQDNGAQIHFTKVENGYRRELYVLEGKNKSVSEFDTEIQKLENGQETNLVMAPIYDVENENTCIWDAKAKVYKYQIASDNFEIEKDYSVYIRNVSAVRTLENGAVVEKSAKGSIKSFKTTKNQVRDLIPFFDTEKTKVEAVVDENGDLLFYDAWLLDKSVQMSVYGYYKDKDSVASEEDRDLLEFLLPIAKNQPNYYNPKLTYYVFDYNEYYDDDEEYVNNMKEGWLKQSTYAAVNNKGKVTLKAVDLDGAKMVRLVVASDNNIYGGCTLRITSVPDALKGKNAKMKIGDTINLYEYLNYTENRKKVPNYRSSNLVIENREEAEEAGFIFNDTRNYDEDYSYLSSITATKQAKNFELKLKDTIYYINLETGAHESTELTASIKITVNALDGVKGLKASYIDDKHITLNFTHTGNPSDFLIEVRDARKDLISRKLISNDPDWVYASEEQYEQNKQQHIVDGLTYFQKTKTYAYTIYDAKLVRLSSYTITVTPMYGMTEAKAATKKVKTTNIPASYMNMAVRPDDTYGGEKIYVSRTFTEDWEDGYSLQSNPFLTSGNTYTLIMQPNNDIPMTRATDTLTWKSSNTKVATVKANPGTYSATLKAVKAGETKIEVTSKITKKVIARYLVCVRPVSSGKSYFGDYEQEWFRQWDPLYTGTVEVLTLSNKVVVNKSSNDYTWVSFTAPAFGEYTFDCNRNMMVYDQKNGESKYVSDPMLLESGQQIYFKVYGPFTLSAEGSEFAKLSTDAPVNVEAGAWVSYVAPEDNYYTFSVDNGNIASIRLNDENQGSYGAEHSMSLKAGDTVLLKTSTACAVSVARREVVAALDKTGNKANTTLTNDNTESWMTYKASVSGLYTFKVTGMKGVEYTYYKGLESTDEVSPQTVNASPLAKSMSVLANALASVQADGTEVEAPVTETVQIWLNEGETLAIKISLGNVELGETDKCEVSVEVSLPKLPELTTAKPLDVTIPETSNAAWVSFTIPADGSYSFKAVDKDGNPVKVTYYSDKSVEFESASSEYILVVPDEVVNEYGEKIQINAKDTIYLKVEENATISVTEISKSATALTAGKAQAVEISSNGKYWYTFTAPQDGTYVFRMDANIPGSDDTAGLDSVSLEAHLYKAVGKDVIRYFNIIYSTETVKLSANQTITFCLDAANLDKDSKITGYIYVDSNAAVTPISAKGVDVTIDNAKDKTGTTKWYSFTASSKGEYQFVWKPAEGSGDARIELYDNGVAGNWLDMMTNYSTSTMVDRNSGAVTYIKVIQTSDTAVKGNLSVTEPASATAEKLVSGVAKENIVLTKDQSKYYTFIAPKKAKYVVTTTVSEKDASANLYWNSSSMNTPYAETGVIEAGSVCTLRLTTNNDKATVKLLVQPLEPKAIAKGGNLEAKNGVPGWYAYQIAKTGRYCFAYTPAKDNQISVQYYDSEYNTLSGDLESRYCDAGTTIYVKATSSAEQAQKATFDTEILNATPLSNSTPIKIAANGKAYYEYKVEKEGIYIFTAKAAENKAVADMEYFVNMDNSVQTLYTNSAYSTFKKGDKLFIRMKSTAEADFTLTVEQKTIELKANTDSDEITLKSGETAYFSFNAYEAGNFVFKTSEVTEGANLSVSASRPWLRKIDQHKGFYVVSRNTEETNTVISFTVRNYGSEDVKFKVRAERVEPQPIEKTAKLTIAKNEMQWLTFKAPEEGRYTVTSSNKEMKLERLDKWGNTLSDLASENIIIEDSTVKEDQRLTMTFAVIYNGEKDTETTDISIAPVDTKTITKTGDTPISLESGASQWIEYTADTTADYTFTLKSGEEAEYMYLYRSLVDNYSNGHNSVFTLSMEPEQKVYFKLTNNTEEKKDYVFTVSARERKVINLTEGMLSEEVTLKYGEEAHFVFEPSDDKQYIFKTPGLQSDAFLGAMRESDEHEYEWAQEFSGYNGFYVVTRKPYYGDPKIKFLVHNYSTKDISFSVMTEPINPVTVTEGIRQIQLEKNEPTWLRFQASENGRYSFSAAVNGTGEEDVISLVQNLDIIGDYNGISSYGLSANSSIQMVVCYYGEETSVSANISARKENIQLFSVNNGEPFTVPAYGSKWFSYTAPADMEYRFDLNCNDGYGGLYLGVYDSLTSNDDLNNMERSITDGYTTTMTEGQTLYFRVRNYDEEAYECSFILTAKVFEEVLNETLSIETYGDEDWTTYTANEAGNYQIIGNTPDSGDFYVEYYRGADSETWENRMNVWGTNTQSMSLSMEAGETIRIKVYSWDYAIGDAENPNDPYEHSIQIRIVHENNL